MCRQFVQGFAGCDCTGHELAFDGCSEADNSMHLFEIKRIPTQSPCETHGIGMPKHYGLPNFTCTCGDTLCKTMPMFQHESLSREQREARLLVHLEEKNGVIGSHYLGGLFQDHLGRYMPIYQHLNLTQDQQRLSILRYFAGRNHAVLPNRLLGLPSPGNCQPSTGRGSYGRSSSVRTTSLTASCDRKPKRRKSPLHISERASPLIKESLHNTQRPCESSVHELPETDADQSSTSSAFYKKIEA